MRDFRPAMFHVKRHQTYALLAVVTAAGATVSGCVGPPAAEWASGSEDVACLVRASEAFGRIGIGYLGSPAADLYTQDQKQAEACLPNAEVTWMRCPTELDIVQGFTAGLCRLAWCTAAVR